MLLDIIQNGNKMEVSYWGSDNKTHIKTFTIPEKEMFNWTPRAINKADKQSSTFTNWDGTAAYMNRLNSNNPKDRLNRYRLYELLDGMDESIKDDIFSYNLPDMYFVDIETEVVDGFPDPDKAKEAITVIGVACPNDTILVLSQKDLSQNQVNNIQTRIDEHFKQVNRKFTFKFKYFKTEYDMLYTFMKLVAKMPMMTGWNFEDFDWKYIINRCKNIKIDINLASPSGVTLPREGWRPLHVGLVDYLKAYKKWTWNSNENYKLDTIGEKIVGIKKVQHAESLQDMYENDFEKYVFYNAIDCGLVQLIHEKCNALTCGLTTAWLGRIKAMDCFSTTYIPENLLRQAFKAQNKVLTVDPFAKKKEAEGYEGAFVKQPIPGLHKYCTCNDYASLYPSLMRQFNIGPETLVRMLPEDNEELKQEWRDKGYIVCASGAVYQKEDGELKKIITDLYFKRKSYKKTSFKYTQIYYDIKDMLHTNASREDINEYLQKNDLGDKLDWNTDEILLYCQTQADIYNNYQLGTKVVINGIYGAFGFAGFYFYNPNIAESVTKQGKNAILNAEKLMNKWATDFWMGDTKTHEKIGISIKDKNYKVKPVTRYIDTDSIYTSYEDIIGPTDWFDHDVWRLTKVNRSNDQKDFTYVSTGGYPTENDAKKYFDVDSIDTSKFEWGIDTIEPGGREFCLTMNRVFMSDFLKKIHEAYAKRNGTPNILDFELEAYNEAGIWLAKKKYIKNMTWAEPNVYYENCSKIKPTGVEIAQTSSSVWVKKKLTELIIWIFKQEQFSIDLFVKEMKKVKKEFMLQSPETVSINKGMNKYADYVIDDTKEMEVAPKAMVTVQGAVLYNWILNNKPKFKNKYQTLVDSDKLCVLYVKQNPKYSIKKHQNDKDFKVEPCEAFSYPAGMYPIDMTDDLEIDYQHMFELLVLAPMNRILVAMGYQELSPELTFTTSLW